MANQIRDWTWAAEKRLGGGPASSYSARQTISAHRLALSVAAAFLMAGLGWVFFTDIVLYRITRDQNLIARFETAKGWIFVGLAGLLLYLVILRAATGLERVWRLNAAIVESIADGVLLLRRDRTIAHANPAAVRMLGCPLEELVGMGAERFSRRFRVSYPNGALVPPGKYVSQRVFEESGPLHYKAVLYPPGGKELVFDAIAAAVRTGNGESPSWVVSVMHDITSIEKLARMRDQFFAAAAHSLKTPVAIIKANAYALAPNLAPDHRRVAASLQRQCDRIDRLVQNLLVLARIRSGTLELHPAEVALAPIIEQIADEPVWSHRELSANATGSPRVFADGERLGLTIRDLVHEACRLSLPDSTLILEAASNGDCAAVEIRYQPLPWREAARGIVQEYDDIGIGRSVAKAIVEAHGGTLSEEVTDGEVSIWIRLPALEAATSS